MSIWWRHLSASSDALVRYASWLSREETARAGRFGTSALRERYIIGRGTLRLLLSDVLAVTPDKVPIARAYRGRPVVVQPSHAIDFNVSHTRDIAVYAIGNGLSPHVRLGIDVEHLGREVNADRLGRKLLTASERAHIATLPTEERRCAFLATWTCKEAMSKATGDGLAAPFSRIAVEGSEPPRVLDGPAPYQPTQWRLHRIPMPEEYVLTLAIYSIPPEDATGVH